MRIVIEGPEPEIVNFDAILRHVHVRTYSISSGQQSFKMTQHNTTQHNTRVQVHELLQTYVAAVLAIQLHVRMYMYVCYTYVQPHTCKCMLYVVDLQV